MSGHAFLKAHGAGNDFVVFLAGDVPNLDIRRIGALCDRRRGIGADGVLVVTPESPNLLRVRYWNRDGSEAFCGNGTRCAVRVAGLVCRLEAEVNVDTIAGPLMARVQGDDIAVSMPRGPSGWTTRSMNVAGHARDVHRIEVGVPHVVLEVGDVSAVPVDAWGAELRHHGEFAPAGANVNFVERVGVDHVRIRTYERGVETETLSCGSGVMAVARFVGKEADAFRVRVDVASGDRLVGSRTDGRDWLTGPAVVSFSGTVSGERGD